MVHIYGMVWWYSALCHWGNGGLFVKKDRCFVHERPRAYLKYI